MRKTFAALLLLLCAALAAGAQEPAGWVEYKSPEGRYSVRLPKEPKVFAQDVEPPAGGKVKQFYAGASDGTSLSVVLYFDYGADSDFSLERARDGVLSGVEATLLWEQPVSLGGHAGKELRMAVRNAAGREVVARVRFYDVARRIYCLQCLTPKAADGPAAAEKCVKFFDSFKVETPK